MSGDQEQAGGGRIIDPADFEVAFQQYFAPVYRFISRRVGSAIAEDLAAETFATAYRRRASFNPGRGSLRAWLFGIATNLVRSHWRAEQHLLALDARLVPEADLGDASEAVDRRPAAALVHVSEVTKRYPGGSQAALDGVSLRIGPGEAVAVMGPSGSGKSTLLNLIAGLDKPTGGTVTVAGQRVDTLSETGVARYRRDQVGMIFQFFHLLEDLTVADNILLPAQLAGTTRKAARSRASRLMTELGIAQHRDAYPSRLSGGERQRVAIARALINEPALLLADEPTGALDSANGEAIGRLLVELNRSGQTLVVVTHSPELAARYARRVIRLIDGRITSDTLAGAVS